MVIIGHFLHCRACVTILSSAGASGYDSSLEKECAGGLPYDILQQREEIRWYTQFLLFEDDLNDFGYVITECRSVC